MDLQPNPYAMKSGDVVSTSRLMPAPERETPTAGQISLRRACIELADQIRTHLSHEADLELAARLADLLAKSIRQLKIS